MLEPPFSLTIREEIRPADTGGSGVPLRAFSRSQRGTAGRLEGWRRPGSTAEIDGQRIQVLAAAPDVWRVEIGPLGSRDRCEAAWVRCGSMGFSLRGRNLEPDSTVPTDWWDVPVPQLHAMVSPKRFAATLADVKVEKSPTGRISVTGIATDRTEQGLASIGYTVTIDADPREGLAGVSATYGMADGSSRALGVETYSAPWRPFLDLIVRGG